MTDVLEEYQRRFESFLTIMAEKLQSYLQDLLTEDENIDRITVRAKEPRRFAEKAQRCEEDSRPKYLAPLTEIQDQIGARVIVIYLEDVTPVSNAITRYFQPIELKEMVPESQWEFGYFGKHLVLPLPRDVVPVGVPVEDVPTFFELQIKTVFQHAWSEANHDLGYKSASPLSLDQQRRLAFTAAQAWGADRIFKELRSELLK